MHCIGNRKDKRDIVRELKHIVCKTESIRDQARNPKYSVLLPPGINTPAAWIRINCVWFPREEIDLFSASPEIA